MENKDGNQLIPLVEELLENGDFFISAIESSDHNFNFEEWKERLLSALEKEKLKNK
ncbi:hypothetical protein [Pantoea sp. BAV 3049]|uniref:hypothetical protein n=1 Tax=Pantoea sp. BAV 3049 TaxID=2654188 RepID=UPI00131E37E1|nr:hypothetical protein [Pantoea sp. BAV 3049]